MMSTRGSVCAGIVSLALLHSYWRWIRRPKLHHPPSPASLPLVGNIFSIPSGPEHLAFAKLAEQLKSDIIFLEILDQKMIVLNTAEDASALLEKRSALYSDRPDIPMVNDPSLMDWSRLPSLIGYNEIWRHYRRIMNNWLNIHAVSQFNDLQERQARTLLQRFLSVAKESQPFEHLKSEIFFVMSSLMFQLAYGYTLQGPQDSYFQELQRAVHNVEAAGLQTNFLVNMFPALLYVPDWLPGTGWKRTGREWRAQQKKAKREPYEWLKGQIDRGTQKHSLLASLLATYTFSKKRDESGREITPEIRIARNALVVELAPFEFELKPRSDEHRRLIIGATEE